MKRVWYVLIMVALIGVMPYTVAEAGLAKVEGTPPAKGEEFGNPHSPNNTADHSKFKELQQEFKSGPEVTRACLSCHTEAAKQIQKTIHWTWLCPAAKPEAKLGKAGYVVNNFCINVNSNEPRCTSCHIGYGWKDKNFDFTAEDKVDCLICHEQTGTYKKFPAAAGHPVKKPTKFMGKKMFYPPDWNKVAQSVARPTRRNCGTCHFFGGGGEGVKHGDLDASMLKPERELDVHMDGKNLNFTCTRCHTTEKHVIAGRCYKSTELTDRRSLLDYDMIKRITCYSCHSETPHKPGVKANDHTDKVACQTCHIPAMARKRSTKVYWDWSQAGKRNEKGKPIVKKANGRPIYHGFKGGFKWEKNLKPEYFWFNGKLKYTTLADKIDPTERVRMNYTTGAYDDPHSRIYPFKAHRGKQPYDSKNNTFVVPHLFGKDNTAFWKNFDWTKAVRTGMDYVGLPFSGEVGFVETEYLFQTTHMVAPKEKAVACAECHTKNNGRLAKLNGFYMPGRDGNSVVDVLGWGGILLAFVGVLGHGGLRLIRNGNTRGKKNEQHL